MAAAVQVDSVLAEAEADELRTYAIALAEHELCAALAPTAGGRAHAYRVCLVRARARREGVRNVCA